MFKILERVMAGVLEMQVLHFQFPTGSSEGLSHTYESCRTIDRDCNLSAEDESSGVEGCDILSKIVAIKMPAVNSKPGSSKTQ